MPVTRAVGLRLMAFCTQGCPVSWRQAEHFFGPAHDCSALKYVGACGHSTFAPLCGWQPFVLVLKQARQDVTYRSKMSAHRGCHNILCSTVANKTRPLVSNPRADYCDNFVARVAGPLQVSPLKQHQGCLQQKMPLSPCACPHPTLRKVEIRVPP